MPKPKSVDEYIASFPPEVWAILERIRLTIRKAAPAAEEIISYNMPAYTLGGVLVYFAAFKKHIGLSANQGRCRAGKGEIKVPRREGEFAISNRRADPVQRDRKTCEGQSGAVVSEKIRPFFG
jgi:uncharacterized protein YdhG (YjbR/CyaY superfamily)